MSALIRGVNLAAAPVLLNSRNSAVREISSDGRDAPATSGAQLFEFQPGGNGNAASAGSEPLMTYADFENRLGEQLDILQQEAREQGLREGAEQAQIDVRKKVTAQLEAVAVFVREARASLDKEILGLQELGTEIVFEAVSKIIGRSNASAETIAMVVREVIQGAKDRSRLVVRVRRADLDWVSRHREQLMTGIDSGSVEFVADDRVRLGGCILETPIGNLDGRLETQLAGLRDVLLAAQPRVEEDGGGQ